METRKITITKRMARALHKAWDLLNSDLSDVRRLPAAMKIEDTLEALSCMSRLPAELPAEFVGETLDALTEVWRRAYRTAVLSAAHGYPLAADHYREVAAAAKAAHRAIAPNG